MKDLEDVIFEALHGREFKGERVDEWGWRRACEVAEAVETWYAQKEIIRKQAESYQGGC